MTFPLLTALVVLPAVGALLVAVLGRRRPELVQLTAIVSSVVVAGMTIWMLCSFESGEAGFQFVSKHTWIQPWGISWHLGVDGISLFLVVLTGILFPLVIIGTDPHHDNKAFLSWLLLLEAGMMGSFLALDLFMFFVFFEIVLVPMYFLIVGWGYEKRLYAGTKFFLYTMVGSAFMLVGIIATAILARRDIGHITFDLVEIAEHANFAASTGRWLFFAFAIAFAIKVPVFPFHTWLPDAHTQAPTAGSVILAGVMLKLGTYGLLRFGVYLFPEAAHWARPLMLTLAVIGDHLRRDRGDDAEGSETSRRLLVGRPPRLHRARHVRAHRGGDLRRRAAERQPRHLDRRLVPARRLDLRTPPHPRDLRSCRACSRSRRSSPRRSWS